MRFTCPPPCLRRLRGVERNGAKAGSARAIRRGRARLRSGVQHPETDRSQGSGNRRQSGNNRRRVRIPPSFRTRSGLIVSLTPAGGACTQLGRGVASRGGCFGSTRRLESLSAQPGRRSVCGCRSGGPSGLAPCLSPRWNVTKRNEAFAEVRAVGGECLSGSRNGVESGCIEGVRRHRPKPSPVMLRGGLPRRSVSDSRAAGSRVLAGRLKS